MEFGLEEKFGQFKSAKVGVLFCQVYNEVSDVIGKITSATALRLLFWIIVRMDDDNLVDLRKSDKEKFASEYSNGKISISAVTKAAKVLCDSGLMISSGYGGSRTGRYFLNPYYFWRRNKQNERITRIKEFHDLLNLKANEEN